MSDNKHKNEETPKAQQESSVEEPEVMDILDENEDVEAEELDENARRGRKGKERVSFPYG